MPRLPRNQLKETIAPGIWIDQENGLHISIPEILAACELENTPENRALATGMAKDLFRRVAPHATLVERPDKPD